MIHIVIFVIGAAVFYAGTMILMKHWGIASPLFMAILIGATFAMGAWCEVEALQVERLSTVYVAILGVECILISVASFVIFGEQVSPRELLGGIVVLSGIVIAAT